MSEADFRTEQKSEGRSDPHSFLYGFFMISEQLVDRLVCAKYIFESGVDALDRGDQYAAGIAVLAFQDAAEMVLRVVAEHLHAQVKENSAFNQILDEIEKVAPGKLTHRTALNQINKARVNFKHLALAPRDEDIVKFRRDLDRFFAVTTNAYLGLDFSSLSLSSLISHKRTRNWIKRAERAFEDERYKECIDFCSLGVHIFQKYKERSSEDIHRSPSFHFSGGSMELAQLARYIESEFQERLSDIQHQIDLIGAGISYADYQRFEDLAPSVYLTGDGKPHFSSRSDQSASADSALFCVMFTRMLILRLQSQYRRPNRFVERGGKRRYVTNSPANVIVYPLKDSEDIEVIEELGVGVELTAFGDTRYDQPGYFAILYQGDCAYVAINNVLLRSEQ